MNSRERILNAIQLREVDHLPCSIYFNSNLKVPGYDCSTAEGQLRLALDLDTDPLVGLSLPMVDMNPPNVKIRTWIDEDGPDKCRLLWQAWDTPDGSLLSAVKMTDEWGGAERIGWDDLTVSNLHKPLVESPDDVPLVKHIIQPVTIDDGIRKRIEEQKRVAQARGLATRCGTGNGLCTLLAMMGAQNAVYFAMDYPDAFAELARIIHETEYRNIKTAASIGVDLVKRFGGYEMTNLYNVEIFERVVMPLLRKEVALAHELGVLMYYRAVTGATPLLDRIASIGFDCIEGGEPKLDEACSFEAWKEAFAGKACVWTGVSTPALLGGNSADAVREEVRHAVDVFGKKGFILGVTNSIRNHFPWQNTLAMIDEWKRIR